jgi:hypothetical protein
MLKRFVVSNLLIVAIGLMNLPLSHAQISTQSASIKIAAYLDDPFVTEATLGRMDASRFDQGEGRRLLLTNDRVRIEDENVIYRADQTGAFKPFAFNPWPLPESTEKGSFKFPDEARFPLFEIVRGPDGKPILTDGLQTWKPINCYLGMTTTFKAANADKDAAEFWSGRVIDWGQIFEDDYVLFINSHSFIEGNAFYSPTARQVFLGVAAYRPAGGTTIRMFETATSWELVAHECGHALHVTLKPNIDLSDRGFRTWSESFGDQMAMWASLTDRNRAQALLQEVDGNFFQSNSLTRFGEWFAGLTGQGSGWRDAFHSKKVSDTPDEEHDRSEVLTGAAYRIFATLYGRLKNQGMNEMNALEAAGEIMGTFLTRSTDYTPENTLTLEDVGKAYLKVDKEFYGGRYRDILVDEFTSREIFDVDSVAEWMEHEARIPNLRLRQRKTDQEIEQLVRANLDLLGIESDFGLKLQSVIRDNRLGQTIVRVQLTDGREDDAALFENHGILTFRSDGTLADYHTPMPSDDGLNVQSKMQVKVRGLMEEAKRLQIDQRGARLSIVRMANGRLTIEARVMRTEGSYCWVEAFTLEHPEGERREVIIPTIAGKLSGLQPNGVQILTADDLNN